MNWKTAYIYIHKSIFLHAYTHTHIYVYTCIYSKHIHCFRENGRLLLLKLNMCDTQDTRVRKSLNIIDCNTHKRLAIAYCRTSSWWNYPKQRYMLVYVEVRSDKCWVINLVLQYIHPSILQLLPLLSDILECLNLSTHNFLYMFDWQKFPMPLFSKEE